MSTLKERADAIREENKAHYREEARIRHNQIETRLMERLAAEDEHDYESALGLQDRAETSGRTPFEQLRYEFIQNMEKLDQEISKTS